MKRFTLALLIATLPLAAAEKKIPANARIFIEDMEQDLDGYIRTEFFKQKVPVQVVTEIEQAEFVLTGSATKQEKRKWHEGWLTAEQDRTEANLSLFNKGTKELIWAGEAGDRSLWWGALARGGHRKVASRLVENLKKHVAKK